MNNIKRNIPNLITLSNLTCGLFAITFSFQGDLINASLCIFLGAFLDFLDGFAARILNVCGEFGKQLDSLADMTTFGIAPGFILFHFIFYLQNNIILRHSMEGGSFFFPSIIALLIPILSAYRLAKFNLDTRQTNLFIGLPTPALAIFIAAIPHIDFQQFPMFTDIKLITILGIIMPTLLIVNIPLFSLKFNRKEKSNSRINFLRILLIITFIFFFFIFKFAAIPFIVILYLILSIINNILSHYEIHS
ncbi:MAG: CDP-alcohol phosphatidyltransferase family protein [Bacteroidota bacterium]|nr:CDP-alcohol phosphatidyltransferase family protein [Bacteroidota bacterium]